MSTLVILMTPRSRDGSAIAPGAEFSFVLSPDGVTVGSTGTAVPASLPRAGTVVAVVSPLDAAWHRVTMPKAPASRLRQALVGVLEEGLLDEPEALHVALAPGARAGEPVWVAAVQRDWFAAQLESLSAAGVEVDRVVPALAPADPPTGHFFTDALVPPRGPDDLWLAWADDRGAACLRTAGGLTRAMLPGWSGSEPRWTATPAAAALAEHWLGAPVIVRSDAEKALEAARSDWNLRQFAFARQAGGLRMLRDSLHRAAAPRWRPVRWGLAALLVVHLVGLNTWAWQQRQAIEARRGEMVQLLRTSHPQVRAVLDAPVQMQRETALLRSAAGRTGDADFETLVAMTAAAWPDGRAPVEQLRFEAGRLTIPAAGWSPAQVQHLRSRVEAAGGRVGEEAGQLAISRVERDAGGAR